jgi:hypothetical protein
MFTKTKIALAATFIIGSSSLALAQGFDPNLSNRYPQLANPHTYGYVAGANAPTWLNRAPQATFQSAPVQLRQERDVGLTQHRGNFTGRESEFDVDRNDRASSPYAGGGF